MPTTYTSLLGLALPATGELSGTWGTTVNDYITQYVDAAVAGAQTISGTQTAVTLSVTNGVSLTQAGGAGTTGSAQYQIINCTGNPASALTVTVPSSSRTYLVLNNTSTNQTVTVKGAATTGVTVAAARAALIAWNGTDFALIATNDASKISGILAVANGGTGLSSGTSGGVPYFSSTSAMASSAALAANALVVGGGAGAAPSTVTTGTGVLTALGTAVGSAGAFVVNGGALGTPSSGTLSNATGLPLTTGVTGTLPLANGGTGQTTAQAAINSLAGAVTSGQYLRGNGTNVVMSAIQAADVPTLNQNTTGTASNVTGTVAVANGGTGATTAANARTNLGATTLGGNLFTIANPSAITFPRFNADNTVSALDAATFRSAIGAGTGGGSVTSVSGTGTVQGLTLSGTVTSSGSLTLGGSLSAVSLTTQVSGTLPIANGGTGATDAATARANLGAGTGNGTVTSVSGTGTVQGLTLTGSVTSSGSLTLGGSLSAVSLTTQVSGTLPVANGGTGATSLTANNVLLGNGTSAVQVVAPGSSGNVLTSNGTTWTSAAPAGGGVLMEPTAVYDRTVTFAGNVFNNNDSSGKALKLQAIQLTATTELVLFYGRGSSTGLYGAVWDNSAKTWGSSVLIRNLNMETYDNQDGVAAIQVASNSVLVVSCPNNSTALQAVIVSASGTTLTVNTATSKSLVTQPIFTNINCFRNGYGRIIQVGSSYVLPFWDGSNAYAIAMTVSGTTVSITAGSGGLVTGIGCVGVYALPMSATVFGMFVPDVANAQLNVGTYSVSGTTITTVVNTPIDFFTSGAGNYVTGVSVTASGLMVGCWSNTNTGGVVITAMNTSGTAQTTPLPNVGSAGVTGQMISSKLFVVSDGGYAYNITFIGVSPQVSTSLSVGGTTRCAYYDGSNTVYVNRSGTMLAIDCSGTAPTVLAAYGSSGGGASGSYSSFGATYNSNFANLAYLGAGNGVGTQYTSAGKLMYTFPANTTLFTGGVNATGLTGGQTIAVPMMLGISSTQGSSWVNQSALSTGAAFSVAAPTGYAFGTQQLTIRRIEL